jgi:hypothetical protein
VNTARAHTKGHQKWNGIIIADGGYRSKFTFSRYMEEWHRSIIKHWDSFWLDLQSTSRSPNSISTDESTEKIFLQIHGTRMASFYSRLESRGGPEIVFIDHSACVCCFTEIAQHTLPCGHVLCISCVKGFSEPGQVEGAFKVRSCPLHARGTSWERACVIKLKAQSAGLRLLSLDG